MPLKIEKTDLAEADLIEIWEYIGLDSAVAADRMLDVFMGNCYSSRNTLK